MTNNSIVATEALPSIVETSQSDFSLVTIPVIKTVETFVLYVLWYFDNCLISDGVEIGFNVIRETANGRASRRDAKQSVANEISKFIRAENFDNGEHPSMLNETMAKILASDFSLDAMFRYRVTKKKDELAVLNERTNESIQKAIANCVTSIRVSFLNALGIDRTGSDANGKQWNTANLSNDNLLSVFQTVAKSNLTAKKTVKVVKRAELESELAELREQVKALTATA